MNDRIFQRIFGMTRSTFTKFFALIEDNIDVGQSTNGRNILPIERVLIFFWWTRACSSALHDAISHDVSEGTIWKSIDIVIDAIYKVVPDLITLPSLYKISQGTFFFDVQLDLIGGINVSYENCSPYEVLIMRKLEHG